jgi:tetratricopeptide (TPR) repeat protein
MFGGGLPSYTTLKRCPMKIIVSQAASRIESMGVVCPALSHAELQMADLQALCAVVGLELIETDLSTPCYPYPSYGSHPARLFIAHDLEWYAKVALVVQHVALLWPGEPIQDARLPDLVALVAVFHRCGTSAGDVDWSCERVDGLSELAGAWTSAPLGHLLNLANEVLAELAPKATRGDAAQIREKAVAALDAAHALYGTGDIDSAFSLYKQAEVLAGEAEEWEIVVSALAGQGTVRRDRGAYPAARKDLKAALRVARRHELRIMEAIVLHDLFGLAARAGFVEVAERLAGRAHALYPPEHPRVPVLAQDISCLWTLQGRFHQALPVAREAARHATKPTFRCAAWANVARAAGGAGDEAAFEEAALQVAQGIALANEWVAESLLDVAHGAASLRLWVQAEDFGTRALRAAVERRMRKVEFEAESLLESVRSGRALSSQPVATDGAAARRARRLARKIVSTLRRRPATLT